jgi:hypothetical protein
MVFPLFRSDYTFIHNTRRNRLRKDRAEKLVRVFSNSRLLRKTWGNFWEAEDQNGDEMVTSDEDN